MAQSRHYSCSACGLEGSVTVGGVRSNYRTHSPFPVICRSCDDMRYFNKATKQGFCCLTCGSTNFVEYGNSTRSKEENQGIREKFYSLLEKRTTKTSQEQDLAGLRRQHEYQPPWYYGSHECPRCLKYSLRFSMPFMFID